MSNGIQHKMLTYEVTPPPGVWNKIAAELDESEIDHVFPSTLYEAEVIPPIGTWNKIQTTLNAEHEAAVPEHRWFSPMLRYAAAAVVIGLLAWGSFQLLNSNKSADKAVVKAESLPAIKEDINSTPDQLTEISTEKNKNGQEVQ